MGSRRLQDAEQPSNGGLQNKEGAYVRNGSGNFRDLKSGRFVSFDPVESFWMRVDKSGNCWLWIGPLTKWPKGYARFRGNYAHRFSYELQNGPVTDGLQVLHRCDVRHCVNPEHLFLGTIADNMRDRAAKGRSSKHSRKLNDAAILVIRAQHPGKSQRALAGEHGVSQRAIGNIIHHRTYIRAQSMGYYITEV